MIAESCAVEHLELSDLSVAEIMFRWPATIGVFIAFRTYCVGCPIGVFHSLEDAAREHDLDAGSLHARIERAVSGSVGPGRRR